jgi:hypothetical protein
MVGSSIPDEMFRIFNGCIPSTRTQVLVYTQSLTGISTSILPGVKGLPMPKADNLTAIYKLIIQCLSVDVSLPYGPPRLDTGIVCFISQVTY